MNLDWMCPDPSILGWTHLDLTHLDSTILDLTILDLANLALTSADSTTRHSESSRSAFPESHKEFRQDLLPAYWGMSWMVGQCPESAGLQVPTEDLSVALPYLPVA